MSKKWTFIGSNALHAVEEEENRQKYNKKMFKWGMKLNKTPYNKPKVHYKNTADENENESEE